MLVAVSAAGRRQVASAQVRGEQFTCPECGSGLVVRVPLSRVPHFAHQAGSKCTASLSRAERRAEARRRAALARSRRRAEAESEGQASLFELETGS